MLNGLFMLPCQRVERWHDRGDNERLEMTHENQVALEPEAEHYERQRSKHKERLKD